MFPLTNQSLTDVFEPDKVRLELSSVGGRAMEIPNPKHQAPENTPTTNSQSRPPGHRFDASDLEFFWCLKLGVWTFTNRHQANPPLACATKFFSNCNPIFWLFSGWNCVAKTLSFQTADANDSP